ncbi:MAG: CsgG/HfaB family protein [Planctomycetota bacterium]|jgi:TolB-like protein
MSRTLAFLLLSLALAAVTGCGGPEAMRGGEGTENPDLDKPALGVGLDKTDIDYMVSKYSKRLFASPFWKRNVVDVEGQPNLAVWPIENATTQHLGDQMLMLLSSLETSLVNSGEVQVVAHSRQQDLIEEIGIQQTPAYDPATARKLGRQLGVEYFLTGKITGVDERLADVRRVQYTLFLQVLEIETGAVKFQHSVSRSKAIEG